MRQILGNISQGEGTLITSCYCGVVSKAAGAPPGSTPAERSWSGGCVPIDHLIDRYLSYWWG